MCSNWNVDSVPGTVHSEVPQKFTIIILFLSLFRFASRLRFAIDISSLSYRFFLFSLQCFRFIHPACYRVCDNPLEPHLFCEADFRLKNKLLLLLLLSSRWVCYHWNSPMASPIRPISGKHFKPMSVSLTLRIPLSSI